MLPQKPCILLMDTDSLLNNLGSACVIDECSRKVVNDALHQGISIKDPVEKRRTAVKYSPCNRSQARARWQEYPDPAHKF